MCCIREMKQISQESDGNSEGHTGGGDKAGGEKGVVVLLLFI